MPCESEVGTERSRHGPFAPQAGRRWRQPDEGLASTIFRARAEARLRHHPTSLILGSLECRPLPPRQSSTPARKPPRQAARRRSAHGSTMSSP
ncbi:hypothetical protein EFR84_27370 [Rhizobium chutanense]|uniref:Uncharacterized protein n=1 Tax=Rhizobium chutanense TaxID=2035448 RepID=A0A432NHA3_9HYPH|nr:hypothetical protein EFR84_27370 [Rhizobium chutanense]